jgi:DNA-binding transcriptional ArsR family regulator
MDENKEQLLRLLGSYSRLKILTILLKYREQDLTLYKITKYSKLSKDIIRRNITNLVEAGLVNVRHYGAIRIYSLNKDNTVVNEFVDFLKKAKLV